MTDILTFLQQVMNGLSIGSLYVLFALGLTLVYGIQKILHIAHAVIFVEAALVALFMYSSTGNLAISITVGLVITVLTGISIDLMLYRPARIRTAGSPMQFGMVALVLSSAAFTFMEDGLKLIFGPRPLIWPLNFGGATLDLFGIKVFEVHLMNMFVSAASIAFLWGFLYKTKIGLAMRANAQNPELAESVGVNPHSLSTVAFLLASFFAGLAGILTSLLYNRMIVYQGAEILVVGLAVIVLGGMESVVGVIVAAYLLGIVETFFLAYVPVSLPREAISAVLIFLVLLIVPKGLSRLWERKRSRRG